MLTLPKTHSRVRFAALARWLENRCAERTHILLIDDPVYGDERWNSWGTSRQQAGLTARVLTQG